MSEEGKQGVRLPDFTIEFGDIRNGRIALGVLNTWVRGRWSLSNFHKRAQGGRDVGAAMQAMPDIPGIHMLVQPRHRKVVLFDPLENDKDLLERINIVAKRARAIWNGVPYTYVPRTEHPLGEDQFKTQLYELHRMRDGEMLEVVQGELPDTKDIEKLPGRELYDVGNSGHLRPKYKDQVEEWERRLASSNA